jgi:replicative DNA helicase
MNNSNLPPHDIEAEKSFLSELISSPKKLYDLPVKINSEMFYDEKHKHVFKAIVELNLKADIITISANLENKGILDVCGGRYYLVELAANNSNTGRVGEYSIIILERFAQRKMIQMANDVISKSFKKESVFELIQGANSEIFNLSQSLQSNQSKEFTEIVDQAAQEAIDLGLGKIKPGVDAPMQVLNNLLGGFQNGKVYIIAARPGMGKTSFASQCVINASQNDTPSMIVSLEMTEVEITKRLFALISDGVTGSMMFSKGPQNESQVDSIFQARDKLKKLNIFVSTEYTSMGSLSSKAKLHVTAKGVKMIVIDYLQLIPPITKKGTKEQEISELSREIKKLALELNIPILLLSQLSRNCESRQNKRPLLSDLRDSGAIEQDADVVMFLYRDAVYSGDDTDDRAEIIVAKNRNGQVGTVDCKFVGSRMLFLDEVFTMKNDSGQQNNELPIF